MSIFNSVTVSQAVRDSEQTRIALVIRFWRHLILCLVFTFPLEAIAARYAVPGILRRCASGELLGYAAAVLLQIWAINLVQMWRCVWWELRLIRATKSSGETKPDQPLSESIAEI
jgi:hypothetical protein